jgi:type III restriction enzyme
VAFGKIAATIGQLGPEYEGTKEFKGRKLREVIKNKSCFFTDIETATGGLGVSQKDAEKWPLDLSHEDWFAFEDNFGTTEEKSFVKFFKERIVEKLKLRFAKVWLVRNERQLCIYSFKDGRRFEPDYILFLKRKRKDKKTEQIQVFVEPKGEGFIATDKWKEEFLLELENEGRLVFDIGDADYRIRGCHFYNETDSTRKTKVREEILELCGEPGEHEAGTMLERDETNRYLIYLPLYSLKAACGRFGEQANVEIEDWVKVSGVKRRNEKLFVVRADGDSMEPLIHNGDYCVFEYQDGACENDDVVLAQYSDSIGDDTMGAYVIKKFSGKKKGDEYVTVKLVSVNEDYDDIKLKNGGRDVKQYKIVGVLRRGIKIV